MEYDWVQKSTPLELGITIVLVLVSILIILGIVYLVTLILSKMMWMFFQISLLILVLCVLSTYIFNSEDSKTIGKNISEQVEKISDDFSNWYDNIQIYNWIAEKMGMDATWGMISYFGINVVQATAENAFEGIKERVYNITNFWQ